MIRIASPVIGEEEIKAVEAVLRSGILASGPKVKELEQKFSEYNGSKHTIATSNGTTALHAAILALELKPGDEVITTPFTFIASANSILFSGMKPVFADIDPLTYNIDTEKIREKITSKTKAVMVVHLFGLSCDMGPIKELCEEKELELIEDACQAHGAEYKGKKVGSIGDIGCFSLYATKNMTTGEGGLVTTNSDELAEKTRKIINHGREDRYVHSSLGYNYRMTDIQAAIGVEQLKKLDKLNGKRRENAKVLDEGLGGICGLEIPYVPQGCKHVYHQYTVRLTGKYGNTREGIQKKLSAKGIDTGVFYPLPVTQQPLYKSLGYQNNCTESEKASKEVLSIPVHPLLSKDDLDKIVAAVRGI